MRKRYSMNKYAVQVHFYAVLLLAFCAASCTHQIRGGGDGIPGPASRPVRLPRADFETISLALKKCRLMKSECADQVRDAAERERVILGTDLARCRVDVEALQARRCPACVVWPWVVLGVGVGVGIGVVVAVSIR